MKIKHAIQRAMNGYDNTFFWDTQSYLNRYFISAIKDFCKSERDTNDKRFKTAYDGMLAKIEKWENHPEDDWIVKEELSQEMWKFFGENIGYFWT